MRAAVDAEWSPRRRAQFLVVDRDGGSGGYPAAGAGLHFRSVRLVWVHVDDGLVGGEGGTERGHDPLHLVDEDDEEAEGENVDEKGDG